MSRIMSCLLLSLLCMNIAAQTSSRELKVGDTVPDIVVKNILNYKTTSASLSDFRGKLLIIDFWATWCNPCVRAFPKMDSLQKKYSNDLQILPVTYESAKVVDSFLSKMYKVIKIKPPTVTGNSELAQLFKHVEIPHYVWINKKGIVQAITGRDEINDINILKVIGDESARLKTKIDERRIVNLRKPIFVLSIPVIKNKEVIFDPVVDEDLIVQSTITKKLDGLTGSLVRDSLSIRIINYSIKGLFSYALGRGEYPFLNSNRVILEVKDSSLRRIITGPVGVKKEGDGLASWLEWDAKNKYSYQLRVPGLLSDKKFEIMEQDLKRYFCNLYDIEVIREKRMVKCLVLVRTSEDDRLATKGGQPDIVTNSFTFKMTNQYLWKMIQRFYTYYFQLLPTPVIDESGYLGRVDIELTCNLSKVEDVNKELNRYGLKFVELERPLDMVIIKDR